MYSCVQMETTRCHIYFVLNVALFVVIVFGLEVVLSELLGVIMLQYESFST